MAKTPFSSTYPNLSSRNQWINGAMDYWQRGSSFSTPANGAYNADRMAHFYDGSGSAFTISRQAFTLGQTEVPGAPKYFHRIQVTSAGSGGTVRYHRQAHEGVANLAGKTITISFYAKADATRSIYLQAAQVFGTGGSPSSPVNTTGSAFNISTAWTKYKVTLTLPSIAGKTLGTNNNDYTDIQFQLPVNTTMTIDLAMVMVNEGNDAADFSRAGGDLAGELARCQRYFEKSYAIDIVPGTVGWEEGSARWAATNTLVIQGNVYYKATKRTKPSITTYGMNGNINHVSNHSTLDGAFPVSLVPGNHMSDHTFGRVEIGAGTFTVGTYYEFHWVADAEL